MSLNVGRGRGSALLTFTIEENVTVKFVSEDKDVFGIDKIDVSSCEGIWAKAASIQGKVLSLF